MEADVGGEFLDWEVLPCSDAAPLAQASVSLIGNSDCFEEIGGDSDSEGIIRSNYFSLDNQGRYVKTGGEFDLSEDGSGSVESDNPSWIDPGLDNRYGMKNSGEFWSDSASDRSEERKFMDVDATAGLGEAEFGKGGVVAELTGDGENVFKLDTLEGKFSAVDSKDELEFSEIVKSQMEELDGIQSRGKELGKFWNDSCGDELVSVKFGDLGKEPEMLLADLVGVHDKNVGSGGNEHSAEKVNVSSAEEAKEDRKPGVDEEKKKIVWWKVPFEVLKYCAFRAGPVWSFSMAAAVMMGVVILGRRLYKLKRKSQNLQLNVTIDDKKVSQFMSRAARLNEAFSVVRRVPMVRPSLPAAGAGINQWPVMSMR